LNTSRRRRRWEWSSPRNRRNGKILLGVIGTGLVGFMIGYAVIALVVFRGSNRPDVVSVPELRELPSEEARSRLSRLGLVMVLADSLPNPDVPQGAVLAQSPLAGREVLPGSGVRVILSAGRERRTVADVSGMGRAQGLRILEALGFTVEEVEESSTLAAGRIVGTEPAEGTVLSVSSPIRVTISSGPPLALVPEVVGLTEAEARSAIQGAGFRVGEVNYAFRITDAGLVLRQFPAAGDSARVGGGIELRVATDSWSQEDP
jgi:eukaryotic-like serine/threonine-protein kinase